MHDEIVGRRDELEEIESFLGPAPARVEVVLLEGEAGIGKTTLWRYGVERARASGIRTLAARPAEAETKLSFSTLGDLLTDTLDDLLPALPAPQRRAVEAALLLEAPEDRAADPRTLSVAVLNSLRGLAAGAPLLVAIDDVQWLDAASASVLTYALRRLDAEPVVLLLARRMEDGAPTPLDLDRALQPGRLHRLQVGPLSLGAVHRLVSDRLGVAFRRPILRRLHELSGGNAFFALELGRALSDLEGRLDPGQPLPVPDEVLALVGDRLGRLPAATQQALTVAAALSQPTMPLIAEAVEDDPYARLDPAVNAHVIGIVGERVRFMHPLLASAAYGRVPLGRRRELHRRLGRLVPDLEERAHHLALAAEGPDAGVARALEEAALAASRRGAQDAAADLAAQARMLTPAQDGEAIRRLGLLEAECALQSGDTPRARTLLEELLRTTRSGPPRAEVLTNLARVHFNGLDWRASVGLLEQALLEAGDELSLRARIELHLAINGDLLRTDVHETLEHARATVELAERQADGAMIGEGLAIQAKSELLLGRGWPQGVVERAVDFEPAMRELPADRWLNDYLASMRAWTDDFEGAITALEDVERIALEQGDEVSLNWALARSAELKCYTGRWQEAGRDIERGHEIALQAGQTANRAIFLATSSLLEAHRGLEQSTRQAGEQALHLAEQAGAVMARRTALSALGFLELSLGRPREADSYLGPLTSETRAAGVGEPGAMRFLPDEIEALHALGRLDEAEEVLTFLEERAEATDRVSALAGAGRCRALLHAVDGQLDAALAALAGAIARYDGVSMPFERARTLTVLGQVQRRAKEKAAARATLQEALTIFEELGAALWAGRARSELARIGGRAPHGGLTPTERRVAELVAEGLSNKDVAATLFVTPKTVEGTLSRVYSKLGVRSRSELAHRLTQRSEASKV